MSKLSTAVIAAFLATSQLAFALPLPAEGTPPVRQEAAEQEPRPADDAPRAAHS